MLETERLILRNATLSDAPFLVALSADPEVMRFTGDDPINSLPAAEKLIRERMIPQFDQFQMSRLIVTLKDGTPVGWCGLKYFPETGEVDLGYRFLKKFWGQGLATEAALACLTYGFETLNLPLIIAKVMPDNRASIKVLHKLGMTFKGHQHDPTDPRPFIRYELKKEELKPCAGF